MQIVGWLWHARMRSLASLVDRKPIDPRVAANLMVEIATGLAAAHAQGVVHRDLKPANILMQTFVEPGGRAVRAESPCGIAALVANARPQIADFGLARVIDHRSMTHDGDVLGTPVYMAPEQAAGRIADVGPAADIYSLGAILMSC